MTTLKNANNPFFFEAQWCRGCGSVKDLCRQRYSDEIMCKECVNVLIERYVSTPTDNDKNFGCTYADIRVGDLG